MLSPGYGNYAYANPFYSAPAVAGAGFYDYSQPIVTAPLSAPYTDSGTDLPADLPPPDQTPVNPSVSRSPFEQAAPDVSKLSDDDAKQLQEQVEGTVGEARSAFKAKAYPTALGKVDAAIAKLPNDPALHELRALILFAKGDYKNASAALYSVLASGPGWNWETMSGLYGDVKDYTTQLRALEADYKANPTASQDAFLLAYHYLTLGEKDAAIAKLEDTQRLIPGDQLSKKMLDYLKNPPKDATPPDVKPKPGS